MMFGLHCSAVLTVVMVSVCAEASNMVLDEGRWPVVKPEYFTPPAPPAEVCYPFVQPQRLLGGGPLVNDFVAGRPVRFAYDFEGEAPDFPFKGSLALANECGLCWRESIDFGVTNVMRTGEGKWRLSFEFTPPLYFGARRYYYGLTVRGFCGHLKDGRTPYPNGSFVLKRVEKDPEWAEPVTSTVREIAGTPQFFVNGKPFYAMWGASRLQGRPDGRHSGMPLNVVTIWGWSWGWYPKTNVINTAWFDQQAEKLRRSCHKEAYFMWDFSIYPPPDWKKAFPEELVADEKGERKRFWKTDYSFASRKAVESMKAGVRAAVEYLESSPYANRIVGYRISSGDTPEWLGLSAGSRRSYDFSKPSLDAFAEWAKAHYPTLSKLKPDTFLERMQLDNGGDLLWNQSRHLNTIAFWEFYSDLTADLAIEMNRFVKDLVDGRKVVGTYHGYSHFLNHNGASQHRAHYAFKKVLDSGAVDFVMSPQNYETRRLGDAFCDMKPFGSIRHHRMVSVTENDMRTHNCPPLKRTFDQTLTERQTVMTMRRDLATELCRGNPAYTTPIHSFWEFDFPAMAEEGRRFRILGQHLLDTGSARRNAEIAVVVGERTATSMPVHWRLVSSGDPKQTYRQDGTVSVAPEQKRNILSGETFVDSMVRWGRVGAPVDYVLAEDMVSHPGDYKLYVFAYDFKYDAAFKAAIDRLRERGTTMLWIYAPGWSAGETCGVEDMKALTGIEFARAGRPMPAGVTMATDGRYMGLPDELVTPLFVPAHPDRVLGTYADGSPGIAAFRQGPSVSVFCGPWQLDMPFVRQMAKDANVFDYVDTTDPIEANDRLFMLHARFAGTKHVRLPRKSDVLDVFTGRIVARNADAFAFESDIHETHVFYLGNDVDEVLAKLNETK